MRTNLARGLIAAVFLVNVQCALAFLLWPDRYAPAFELGGVAGDAMVRGLGVLFLMWNVPYAVALWNPVRHRNFVFVALAMQAIGLVGETLIFTSLPATSEILRASLTRFILFDALGWLALLAAAWLVRKS
jgi:hypothetical protein